mmetsp:Transcript_12520/g.14074  ORF Transcript_12520/g.14074 Transcript_12520/m.14074 type:complete len:140 (-) Transcript_12520:34-453(-)
MSSESGFYPYYCMAMQSSSKAYDTFLSASLNLEKTDPNLDILCVSSGAVKTAMVNFQDDPLIISTPEFCVKNVLRAVGQLELTEITVFYRVVAHWLFQSIWYISNTGMSTILNAMMKNDKFIDLMGELQTIERKKWNKV